MDGFADRKANFWGTADNPLNLKGNLASDGVSRAGTVGVASRLQVDGETTRLLYTDRAAPQGILKGDVDPNSEMDISVYLKSKESDLRMERYRSMAAFIRARIWLFAEMLGLDLRQSVFVKIFFAVVLHPFEALIGLF